MVDTIEIKKNYLKTVLFGLGFFALLACGDDASADNFGLISRLTDHAFAGEYANDPAFDSAQQAFSPLSAIDHQGGKTLASLTKKQIRRNRPQGKCLRWVRIALTKYKWQREQDKRKSKRTFSFHSLPRDSHPFAKNILSPGRSAADFMGWALQNPASLCTELGLANITDLPYHTTFDGMVFVYGRGKCGFHRRWGHIEVVTNAEKKEVCSDHCRKLQPDCKPDIVLAPVTHCGWL
ncbi:MAG: hypothetical protein HYW48_07990 [Deltaproteobacteria bacterium]|nr:hypothetical protein [Deltaproteobacteria bacterium]